MAKGAYIGVDGIARKVKNIYIGVDGVARKVKKGYIGVENKVRQWFASYRIEFNTKTSTHSSFSMIDPSAGVDGDTWRCTINYSLSSYVMGTSRPYAGVNIYDDDAPLAGRTLTVSGIVYTVDSYSTAVVSFVNSSGATISSTNYKGSESGTTFTETFTIPNDTETIYIYIAAGSPGTNRKAELLLTSVTLDGDELI